MQNPTVSIGALEASTAALEVSLEALRTSVGSHEAPVEEPSGLEV